MRIVRDYVNTLRLGSLPTEFYHITAYDVVPASNTTPAVLTYQHGLVTGQWVAVGSGPSGLVGFWQVTRVSQTQLSLNGTVASGAANVTVIVYLPVAFCAFSEDTWESPVKLIGPERLGPASGRAGEFSFSVTIEESF